MREKPDKPLNLFAKTIFALLLLFILLKGVVLSQSITWERSYLGSRFSAGYSTKQSSDGNYITCGSRYNYGGFIAKLNSYGDTLWVKYFPVTEMYSIVEANDGNYVAIGISTPLYIVKVNPSGNTIWSYFITEPGYDVYPYHISKTIDNCFIVTGKVEIGVPSNGFGYLIKIDNNGNKQWSNIVSQNNYRIAFEYTQQLTDSSYIVTGSIRPANISHIILLKTNKFGDTVWSRTYGGEQRYTNGENVFKTIDNGYFIIGQTNGENPEKLLFYKTDSTGNMLWSKEYNAPEAHYGLFYGDGAVQLKSENAYILCGYKYNYPALDTLKTFLLKIDTGGNRIWERNFYSSNNESRGWSVDVCSDSGFVISGQQYVNGIPNYSLMHFLKTNKSGEITPVGIIGFPEIIPKNFEVYQNFPNPFNPVTNIKFDIPQDANVSIKIYDLLGKEVFSINDFKRAGSYEFQFDGANLSSGMYFYSLETSGYKETKKMVLIK